ncbi:MAG: hypothetical protein R3265_05275 [Hyphomonas sp.]|nr:hypothetical protein [Hyphomonas sp.]
MLRLLSIILLLCGLGAAGYAGSVLMDTYAPRDKVVAASQAQELATEQAFEEAALPPALEEELAELEPLQSESVLDTPADAPAAGPVRSMRADLPGGDVFPESVGSSPGFDAPPSVTSRSANVTPQANESFVETLKSVPVAHETPATAEYKRAFDVTLAIDSTGDDTAVDALPGRGNVVEGTALVSDRVEARLSGANFEIIPMSPEIQALSPLTENVWRWSVLPLSAGSHDLVFEIYAIDEDTVVPLRTFRDTVTVQVSGINRAIAFADQANPLFVLLGGLGSAIAGLIGLVRFFGRN